MLSSIKNKPIHAIKFRKYCKDNFISAKQIAKILHLNPKTIYCYWAGTIQVPDECKKIMEQKLGLPIYEIFYNESFDVEAVVTLKKRGA
jgi:hypothetical protein